MKQVWNNPIFKKGVFALAVVAIAGASGLVYAATSDNTGNAQSGYGTTGEQATAAAATFASSVASANNQFVQQVDQLATTAQTRLGQNGAGANDAAAFDSQFHQDTNTYNAALNTAFATFNSRVQNAANTAESKDQFIDQFNHAKADYLNAIDAAKNQLADKINKYGDTANQIKDQFMNGFNSTLDTYSNQLEQYKNTFADTISNL